MLIRALIVLLLAFNLGVAGWWLLRAPPAPAEPAALPAGVPRLQLVREASDTSAGASAPAPTAAGAAERVAAASQCLSLGPFETTADMERARAALQPIAPMQMRGRQVQTGPISGWRVYLPPLPDLAAAQDAAARVAEAGFTDYFVMRQGADANAVALGRYANEAAARAHAAALAEAGFAAAAEPIRSGPVALWLDLRAGAGFDLARALAISGAPRRETLDCAGLQ